MYKIATFVVFRLPAHGDDASILGANCEHARA